jgi:membrane dipeptidase
LAFRLSVVGFRLSIVAALYHVAVRWVDGHLDLAYLAVSGRDLTHPCEAGSNGCVSLPALREGGVEVALATIFTEVGVDPATHPYGFRTSNDLDAAEAAGRRQLETYDRLRAAGDLLLVRSAGDLETSSSLPRIVLLMEGADPIRSPEEVQWWHERGLRIVGLTWALGSRYAGGNEKHGPLTSLGRELVAELDRRHIIHDVSHLADEAFDELMALARGQIVATHSNCRELLPPSINQRHLRDDQIVAINKRGGIVGLNLFTKFLVAGRRAAIADCLRHVERMCELMGHRRGVALGSDMDGGFGADQLPQELDHPAKLARLAEALRESGWSDEEVRGFASDNWLGLLRSALPA